MIKLTNAFINPAFFGVNELSNDYFGEVRKDSMYRNMYYNPEGYMVKVINKSRIEVGDYKIDSVYEGTTDITENIYEGMVLRLKICSTYLIGMTEEEFNIEVENEEKEKIEKAKRYEERRKAEHKKAIDRDMKLKNNADLFYSKLDLEVRYTPVYMIVGSGLSENSWGDGLNKRSVVHLRLDGPLSDGKRFNREKGELLCKQERKGKATFWLQEADCRTINGKDYFKEITCKSCLKILKNKGWLKE